MATARQHVPTPHVELFTEIERRNLVGAESRAEVSRLETWRLRVVEMFTVVESKS